MAYFGAYQSAPHRKEENNMSILITILVGVAIGVILRLLKITLRTVIIAAVVFAILAFVLDKFDLVLEKEHCLTLIGVFLGYYIPLKR